MERDQRNFGKKYFSRKEKVGRDTLWEISINLISIRFLIDFRAWKEIEEILERIFFKEEESRERFRYLISIRFFIDLNRFECGKRLKKFWKKIFFEEEKSRKRYSLKDFDI